MKKIILSFSLMLLSYFGYGQQLHQYYTVFKRSVNYQHVTGPNAQEYYGTYNADNDTFYKPISFTFNYNGQNYTAVNISTNGALRFGNHVPVSPNNLLESTTDTDVIAPLWDDLFIRSADQGKIVVELQGISPYRRFVIEWRNISWRSQGSTVSFKAILYETTNNIEFQYGPANLTDTNRSASIGISQGTAGTNHISITPTSDYMFVSAGTPDNNINTSQYPGNGTTFEFKHLTYVPDDHLEQAMIDQGWDTTLDDYVETRNIITVHYFGPINKYISDATGIEDMKTLQFLQIGQNNLTDLINLDNRQLILLSCENNQIAQIDVTRLVSLEKLYASWNNISQIDVTNNPNLETLHLSNNQISQIDLSQNPNLEDFTINNNIITSIDVSHNPGLNSLNLSGNNLTSIDLSNNPDIHNLDVGWNAISALDITNMTHLYYLHCGYNQITNLDLTHNYDLHDVEASNNLFEELNLINTQYAFGVQGLASVRVNNNPNLERVLLNNLNNQSITNANFTNCPQLYCISVDDEAAANAGTGVYANWQIDPNTSYAGPDGCPARTYVPGDNFEHYLETHTASGSAVSVGNPNSMGNGTDNDDYVLTERIENVNQLNISNKGIADLTGIEDFASLVTLYCQLNDITHLDVSQNSNLQYLYCSRNPLTSLVTGNASNLRTLDAGQTQLNYMNYLGLDMLQELHLNQTNMQNLDLQGLTNLEKVYCFNALLTGVNLQNVPNLKWLFLEDNQLTYINLDNNNLLERVNLSNNHLGELHIQNGGNNLLSGTFTENGNTYARFRATGNPNLTCVFVDDATAANNGTGDYQDWQIDATANYVENTTQCDQLTQTTYVPDTNFEHYLETHTASGATVAVGDVNSMGNGTDGDHYVLTHRIDNVTYIDVSNKNIADLTGIEDFTALESFSCDGNQIGSLNMSQNQNLEELFCSDNQITSLTLGNNPNLTDIECFNNSLSDLDISQLPNLTSLDCEDNQVTDLNVSNNTALEYLTCDSNQITTLDISNNTALINLSCGDNQLTNLEVSNNTALTAIYCQNNQLTSLDVSQSTALNFLVCNSNQITTLDVSNNTALTSLSCQNNQLTGLDISQNAALIKLICSSNQLTGLNVKNGHNTGISDSYFNASNNPNLTCIQVDDAVWSTGHWHNIDATASFSDNCHFNETYVPDDNFEHYLETHDTYGNTVSIGAANSLGNGIDGDDYVSTTKIETVTSLNVSVQNITDLTGIEDFTDLQSLLVYTNQLSSLDVTNNQQLTFLNCANNQLTSLNVSGLSYLEDIWAYTNQLASIDISSNTALKTLYVGYNQLTSLDITHNHAMLGLSSFNNQLTSLDVSQNPDLQRLFVQNNQLTALDVDNNPLLNKLTCNDNQLTELHIQNGANNLLSGTYTVGNSTYPRMRATNNPDLTCIYVDNVADANNGTGDYQDWEKDAHANYVADAMQCSDLSRQTYVPDDNFEAYLEANNMGDGITNNNNVYTANIENVIALDVHSQNIMNITGIEDFTALQTLSVFNNQLTSLNVSNNTNLLYLYCNQNQLTTLDVSQNTSLISLYAYNNQLTSLDVSNIPALVHLYCYSNQLSTLDLSHNTNLKELWVYNNQLISLDADNNPLLEVLWSYNNLLTEVHIQNGANNLLSGTFTYAGNTYARMNVTNNPNLTCIYVDNLTDANNGTGDYQDWEKDAHANYVANATQCTDLSRETLVPDANFEAYLEANNMGDGINNNHYVYTANIENVQNLNVYNRNISDLTGIEDFTALTDLNCNNNHLQSLNVTQNTSLIRLYCNYNNLTGLDVSHNTGLTELYCNNNQLTVLDVSQNTALTELICFYNELTDLDVSNNTNITKLYCAHNQLTDLNVKNGHNTAVSDINFNTLNNPNLTCIQVDDATWSTNNWHNIDAVASFSEDCSIVYYNLTVNTVGNGSVSPSSGTHTDGTVVTLTATPDNGWEFTGWSGDLSGSTNPATITMNADKTLTATFNQLAQTYVPDDNFEAYLEAHGMGNGIANDNNVTTANINTVTSLDVSNQNISDLTGIEDFTALTTLNCNSNNLSQIDVSQNTALVQFYCGSNHLTTLDVSNNVNLENLICSHNQLSQIDISQNTALTDLGAYNNQLTGLDVTHNTNLVNLQVQSNGLTSLDVSQNPALETLWCHTNQLTNLNLTNNPTLHNIRCDVNQLSNLDIRNGNNATIGVFNSQHNPDLTCIFVDDSNASYLSSWAIDGTETFVANDTECDLQTRWTYVPDDNFENYLETHSAIGAIVAVGDSNSMGNGITNDDYVSTGKIETVSNLNISSRQISDLTGIEDFMQLENLNCSNNDLTVLNLSQNSALISLDCRNNALTNINITNSQALNSLICYQNALTSLDLNQNANLITLSCSYNQISSLDLSHNIQLENLFCQHNNISNLNLNGITHLVKISAFNNQLSNIYLSNNPGLIWLYAYPYSSPSQFHL